jgi:16S rRNA (adenine1518-N6/adenine1519-N6)-dimethyltransferase
MTQGDIMYVDEHNQVIGSGSILHATKTNTAVRVVRIQLTNSKGELLLQRRSKTDESFPGRWDTTASGHVDKDEDYRLTAPRELAEEMGIEGVDLTEVAAYFFAEPEGDLRYKRFTYVFIGTFDGEPIIDDDEVIDSMWLSPDELKQQMNQTPEQFTPGLARALEEINKKEQQ